MTNNWQATAKQRAYGIALEQQLALDRSDWLHMTVDEARERIGALVDLRDQEKALRAREYRVGKFTLHDIE